jgi:hypothetical protein
VRSLLLSLIAVLIGGAMVAGGVWGVIDSVGGDDSSSSAKAGAEAKTSSASDCTTVAQRDPRFALPHDLLFGPSGRATVQCEGSTVTFAIDIPELQQGTFYEVVLERGRREEEIGSILVAIPGDVNTVTVDPEVRLRRYDFLTVRVNRFHNPGVDQAPFSAAL